MNPCHKLKLAIVLLFFSICSKAQNEIILSTTGTHQITAADSKITSRWVPLTCAYLAAPSIKIPKRKKDSPFFCDELIKYKNGYIINCITTSPSGGFVVDVRYDFYYFDIKANKIYKLAIAGIDSIESIITFGNGVYASGKAHGVSKVVLFDGERISYVPTTITATGQSIGSDSWIKLGLDGTQLYALDKNGLFNYTEKGWGYAAKFSIDSFYTKSLHYRRSATIIPTENMQIHNNRLYFLQEVLQERTCYLIEYNLDKNDGLVNFWDKYGIHDNYQKEINSYTILSDGSVLIGASRLYENYLLMQEKKDGLSVSIFNNSINNGINYEGDIKARKAIMVDSTVCIVGDNGIFEMKGQTFTPLVYFSNGTQEIKDKGENIHFDFYPRCFERVDGNIYLIGGQFGGLYQVDIQNRKIVCLDDIDEDKITSIALGDIK